MYKTALYESLLLRLCRKYSYTFKPTLDAVETKILVPDINHDIYQSNTISPQEGDIENSGSNLWMGRLAGKDILINFMSHLVYQIFECRSGLSSDKANPVFFL